MLYCSWNTRLCVVRHYSTQWCVVLRWRLQEEVCSVREPVKKVHDETQLSHMKAVDKVVASQFQQQTECVCACVCTHSPLCPAPSLLETSWVQQQEEKSPNDPSFSQSSRAIINRCSLTDSLSLSPSLSVCVSITSWSRSNSQLRSSWSPGKKKKKKRETLRSNDKVKEWISVRKSSQCARAYVSTYHLHTHRQAAVL